MMLLDTRYRFLSEGALYTAYVEHRARLSSQNPAIRAEARIHLLEIQAEMTRRTEAAE